MNQLKVLLLILPLTVLAGCGEDELQGDKFTLDLTSVDVRLAGSGDAVTVDTSGVNSGTLTLKRADQQ